MPGVLVTTAQGSLVGSFPAYLEAFEHLRHTGWSVRPDEKRWTFSCALQGRCHTYDELPQACELYETYRFEELATPTPAPPPPVKSYILSRSPDGRLMVSDSWETFFTPRPWVPVITPLEGGVLQVRVADRTYRASSREEVATRILATLGWTFLAVPETSIPQAASQGWVGVVVHNDRVVGAYDSLDFFFLTSASKACGLFSIEGVGTQNVRAIFSGPEGLYEVCRRTSELIFDSHFQPRGWKFCGVTLSRAGDVRETLPRVRITPSVVVPLSLREGEVASNTVTVSGNPL